jgi:type I restriction enzyme R subunit
MNVFSAEQVEQFIELFVVRRVTGAKLQGLFKTIVENGYEKLPPEQQKLFRKETARYVRLYHFVSQIMTFTDVGLEKFYLFAKLLLKQLPYQAETLPREVMDMVDMDKYRVQEEQNGRIVLAQEDAALAPAVDEGSGGDTPQDREKLQVVVKKLNEDYGIAFKEADRVVNAIKTKLEADVSLRDAFRTNSIEFLRRQKLEDSIKQAFVDNADEFLSFMSKTETDPGFGKFFFSEMFEWYDKRARGSAAGMNQG